jgi:hypothetical protein
MELLKFSDSGRSPRQRKNPAGFIGAGIMVAVMGLSSTLAGTITIGTGNAVEFGQGVVTAAACDPAITVTPTSSFNPSSSTDVADSFTVSAITLSGIGGATVGSGDSATTNSGCLGKTFEIRAYYDTQTVELGLQTSAFKTITVTLPTNGDSVTAAANFNAQGWSINEVSGEWTASTVVPSITGVSANTNNSASTGTRATASSSTDGIKFTVSGLRIPSTVTKITVETRAPATTNRTGASEAAAQGRPGY